MSLTMFTLISGPSGLPNFTPKLFVNLPEMHMLCWLLDIFLDSTPSRIKNQMVRPQKNINQASI